MILYYSRHNAPFLAEEVKDKTADDDRGNLAGHIDADGMHQKEVLFILCKAILWTTRADIGNAEMLPPRSSD
jgi:hypothetical protein